MNVLSPAGWIYGWTADLRNLLYEKRVLETFPLGCPAVSIGNITAGGTGKTPLAAYTAEILASRGRKPAILTRGYGRQDPGKRVLVSDLENVLVDARLGGDEPVELARKLLGKAIVIADRDRVSAAKWARQNFDIDVFLLDDAFQHRRAERDLDIVCIDGTNPFGNRRLLPAGMLREPLANLRRADAIVITRANLIENVKGLKETIREYSPDAVLIEAANAISALTTLDGTGNAGEMSRDAKYLAFCGLGNPSNFFRQLKVEGFDLAAKKPFPDHHYYSPDEIRKLENLARSAGADALLTTAKDGVKLMNAEFSMPCLIVENRLELDDAKSFEKILISSL